MPVVDGIEQDFAGRLQVVRLNFNDPRNADAIRTLRVRGHPTVVLIDRRGIPQEPLLGRQTDAKLRPRVEALLGS
jgi:hypothetical protein